MVGGLPLGADDDEQYKEEQPPQVEVFLSSVRLCVCGWDESDPRWVLPPTVVASSTYIGLGPLPKY